MRSTPSERAARRRAEWQGEVVSPGTPKPRLYEDLTPPERLAALARLNRLAWRAAGGADPRPCHAPTGRARSTSFAVAELGLPEHYVDLLEELDAAAVDYLLIGGWAVAVHGHGRATDDLDVFVRATPENAARIMVALKRFGAPIEAHQVTEASFAKDG